MRLAVTGTKGQVVRALLERAAPDLAVLAVGRPEIDLAAPDGIPAALERARPDIIVNCAAYTAVDRAEDDAEAAFAVNARGAGAVAAAARALDVPVIQLSTDYVFDGTSDGRYVETDMPRPLSVYGASKLAGEKAVADANPDHAILRTSWVYSNGGANFPSTMLRLAQSKPEISVVADQFGAPTHAADIADAILRVAQRLRAEPENEALRGVFHMTAAGETSWAGFAEAIFAGSARRGGPTAIVVPIGAADYPTRARRPANSRLDCARLKAAYGIELPHWRDGLERYMERLVEIGGPATR